MDEASSARGGDKKHVQNFGLKSTGKTEAYMGGYY
jgi:hypothetical protein